MKNKKLYLNLRERYNFTCCECRHEQSAAPSMFMSLFQLNAGGGSCSKCKEYLFLQINEDNKTMTSYPHSEVKNISFKQFSKSCYSAKENIGKFND